MFSASLAQNHFRLCSTFLILDNNNKAYVFFVLSRELILLKGTLVVAGCKSNVSSLLAAVNSVPWFNENRPSTFFNTLAYFKHWIPGRTFLGKRRYFSGIAALTPLTPLTYKQNAVNAFIPTKKTPLTPLYRQKNAVNAAIFLVKRR